MKEIMEKEANEAILADRSLPQVTMAIKVGVDKDLRRYNAPAAVNEVAAVFVGDCPPENVDVIVYPKNQPIKRLNNLASSADPMVYPLLFPHGEPGYQIGKEHERRSATRNTVTINQFYCYRLQIREPFSILHNSTKLFQQYCVDGYCKVEANKLWFIRNNQDKLRVENYAGLMDHVERIAEKQDKRAGKVIILPSSFYGSLRQMKQRYLDSIAIMRVFGKPDLFITFTCNPLWPEITDNLLFSQKPADRPDLVARVFHAKLRNLIDDLLKKQIFGVVWAYTYTVEYQKRGLPHAHILVILETTAKPKTANTIDELVRAEIPMITTEPKLHGLVKKHMIHLKCGRGAPCEQNGTCKYNFPKTFAEETNAEVETYPQYRRPDNGLVLNIGGKLYDNRHVVPYNSYLLAKYEAHINVEICATVKSIKYLFKYIFKGYDSAVVEVSVNWDEVKSYLDCRYVSSPEACWRIFEFEIMDRNIVVVQLGIHLPNLQQVLISDDDVQGALAQARNKLTHLLAFFKTNEEHALQFHADGQPCTQEVCPNSLLFVEFPKYYCWLQKECRWKMRQKGGFNTIGRISTVSPKNQEIFCLRILLHHVKGPQSFSHLKTFEGQEMQSFKQMCIELKLLDDDDEYDKCLKEAASWQMPSQLINLFVLILMNCTVASPLNLFQKVKPLLSENSQIQENELLLDLENRLSVFGKSCTDFGLPQPRMTQPPPHGLQEYDEDKEAEEGRRCYALLNDAQREIVDAVLQAVLSYENGDRNSSKVFFIDGPAGTGKTFVYNTLLNILRGQSKVALPVAWTGIAAVLLQGGRTCHNLFKLPVPIHETSTSNIKVNTTEAGLLLKASLILWDEAPMAPKEALVCVDKLFRDIADQDKVLFGAKVILLGGDFRQLLPVVPGSNRVTAVLSSIKFFEFWKEIKQYKLTVNMRAAAEEILFQNYLLKIGEGKLEKISGLTDDHFRVPANYLINPEDDICIEVFGNEIRPENIATRAILCPKNVDANDINDKMLKRIRGPQKSFFSVDTFEQDPNEEDIDLPIEFVNSLNPSGLPPHELKLKNNVVIMLLRNLNVDKGLCNGTRLKVIRMSAHVLDCLTLTGSHSGSRVFIPRITLSPSDTEFLYKFKRKQFPVRVSFAITINKSQGQTFDRVGLYLPQPVFTHGQMYVAFSRVRKPTDIVLQVLANTEGSVENKKGAFTKNIVYHEVLI